jgi:hypothetical protein
MSPVEVITSVQRRRRWSAEEKRAVVGEAEQPGMSISAVARKYGIHPSPPGKEFLQPKREGLNKSHFLLFTSQFILTLTLHNFP